MTLEEFAEILVDLKLIKSRLEDFQQKHGETIANFAADDVKGEEYLYMEVLLDIFCKITDINKSYLFITFNKKWCKTTTK